MDFPSWELFEGHSGCRETSGWVVGRVSECVCVFVYRRLIIIFRSSVAVVVILSYSIVDKSGNTRGRSESTLFLFIESLVFWCPRDSQEGCVLQTSINLTN